MKNRFGFFLCVVFSLLILSACQIVKETYQCNDAIGCVEVAPGEPIQIGVVHVLSGDIAHAGTEHGQVIELAIADKGGKILGHPVVLQSEDTRCSAEGGANAALKIVANPQAVGVIGPICSSAATTASQIVSEAGLVMISGTNSAPSLTSVAGKEGDDWHAGYFRTANNDALKGEAAAHFAYHQLGIRRAATMNAGEAFSQQLADAFQHAFEAAGGEIALDIAINRGDTNMRPALDAVDASEAELLFFPSISPEGELIIQQTAEITGLQGLTLMAEDALLSDAFLDALPDDPTDVYFVGVVSSLDDLTVEELASSYQAMYGSELVFSFAGFVYDAANVLMQAIESSAVQMADGTLYIGRQALRDAVTNTKGYQGLSGQLTCDSFGDCGNARFVVILMDETTANLEAIRANVIFNYHPEP